MDPEVTSAGPWQHAWEKNVEFSRFWPNGVAQGQGPNVDAVPDAIAAAEEFAKLAI